MSSHASAELLSAYLDKALQKQELQDLEGHLESCRSCSVRLDGLRRVVKNLRGLEQLTPPAELHGAVARRIALAGERRSLADKLEAGMSTLSNQSPMLSLFGVVIALALFLLIFSYSLERYQNQTTPVIFQDLETVSPDDGSRLGLADRWFEWRGGTWIEDGVDSGNVTRRVALGSPEAEAFFAAYPELGDLASLERPIVLEIDGEVVALTVP